MIHSLPKWGVSRRQEFSNSNPHQAPVHKGGSEEIRTNRTSLARLTSEKKPMHTQSTESCAVQPNNAQAQSLFERRFQQRLEKRIEKRRGEEAKLSNSQREHLFQTRRYWMISTYDKRLALLEAGQDVCKIRRALRRERTAGPNNSGLGVIPLNSGRRPSTACVSNWVCHPCGLH